MSRKRYDEAFKRKVIQEYEAGGIMHWQQKILRFLMVKCMHGFTSIMPVVQINFLTGEENQNQLKRYQNKNAFK